MVAFNQIPNTLRIPFVTAEFDSSRAAAGPGVLAYRALLVGQKLPGATAAANSLSRVTSADAVATLTGRGSQLHRMAIAWFAGNRSTEVWIGVLADHTAGVHASGSITASGAATANGTISLLVGGELVQVAVASGDSASTIAAAIATAIGKHASGTATFATALAGHNVTVGSTIFVGTAGAVTPGAATYSVDTSNAAAAASFAAQVNAHATAGQLAFATASVGVATLRARQGGTAGNSIALASSNATITVSGATLAGATADTNLAVHATVSGAAVTLLARNAGAVGNEFDLRANYAAGEALPAGVTLTIVQPTGGATNPVLSSLIAALGDSWYQVIAHPYTDATSLTAIENELSSRFGPLRMIDGHAFTAKADTYAAVGTLGDSRNSQHSTIIRTDDSPTPPAEYAAHVAAVAAYSLQIDPARPLQTLPLPFIKAPPELGRDTAGERNLLLYDGISTTRVGAGDLVQIERLVTTSQRNAAGSPDTSYLDVTTMFTLLYARYSFRNRIASRYPRHKLGNDSTRYPAGEAVITPAIGKAEAVAWFLDLSTISPVVFEPGALDQFKADLVVVRNADVNRLDFLVSPDILNQFIVGAIQIQFKL